MRGHPGVPRARAPPRADGRARRRPHAACSPTLASLLEERMRDDPELTHAVIHALNEWLLRGRGRSTTRTASSPRRSSPCRSSSKAIEELEWVRRARRQDRADPSGAGARLPRLALVRPARSSTRSGRRCVERRHPRVDARAPTAATSRYQTDWTGPQEMLPFRPRPVPADDGQGASDHRHDGRARRATACSAGSPSCASLSSRTVADWVLARSCTTSHDTYKKMPQASDRGSGRGVQAQRVCSARSTRTTTAALIEADRRRLT